MRASLSATLTRSPLLSLLGALSLSLPLLLLGGCQTYQDDLARSQRAFEHADYERALAIFRVLEPDVHSQFSVQEKAQYAYLRGMTDFRVGYKVDARHWLAIAHALDAGRTGVLPKDWRSRLKDTLAELNEQVYSSGIQPLAESQEDAASRAKTKGSPEVPAKPKSEDDP